MQVVHDDARAQGRYRACKAWGPAAWKEERDKDRASRVAEQVRRAAVLTAELAAQSEKEVSEVCSHPPGLHDETAAVAPQLTSSLSLVVSNPLPLGQSIPRDPGRSRGGQPRSDARAQEAVALADEEGSLFVKATGKDEARMRAKLTGMKLENLRKERECWRKRAEIKQRLQDRKEEAWELFRRSAGLRPKLREEFEREYARRVMRGSSYSPFGNSESEEKSLREWRKSCSRRLWQKSGRGKRESARRWGKRTPVHNSVNFGTSCTRSSVMPCHRS